MVVDTLHREEHTLLLADGQDLAQAAKQCFLRFPAADGGLLCHVGGLAAHAAGPESFCHRHLAQGFRYLSAALVLVRIAQLNVGASTAMDTPLFWTAALVAATSSGVTSA